MENRQSRLQKKYIEYLDFCYEHNLIPMYDLTDFTCELISGGIVYDSIYYEEEN